MLAVRLIVSFISVAPGMCDFPRQKLDKVLWANSKLARSKALSNVGNQADATEEEPAPRKMRYPYPAHRFLPPLDYPLSVGTPLRGVPGTPT